MAQMTMVETPTAAVHALVAQRKSPRAFSEKPVEFEKLLTLFEAARWAPSSMNEQPWRFIFATQDRPEAHQALASVLAEANRKWAEKAPVLIATLAAQKFEKFDKLNTHAWHDLGLAVGNLSLQATALGLALHQMGGFDRQMAKTVLNIPEGFEPVTILAVGYPGDPATLPEDLRARESVPRVRRPLSEIVFEGAWAKPIN